MRRWLLGVLVLGVVGLAGCGSAPRASSPSGGQATATATRPAATVMVVPSATATLPPSSATPRPPTATAPPAPTSAPPTTAPALTATPQPTNDPVYGSAAATARLGRDVALRVGERAAVEGEGVVVQFASVVEDSRCPVGVQCVRAGRVVVAVRVGRAGQAGEEVTLASDPKDASAKTVNGYTVALVGVQPAKTVPGPAPSEYVITLTVTKG